MHDAVRICNVHSCSAKAPVESNTIPPLVIQKFFAPVYSQDAGKQRFHYVYRLVAGNVKWNRSKTAQLLGV